MSDQVQSSFSDQAVRFFKERVDWEKSDRDALFTRATGWKWFSIFGWSVATVAIAAVIPLTVMHDFVPIVVTVDRFSGDYQVRIGRERIDIGDKKNETRMISDVGRFVKAREGFTRGEAEANYQLVYYSLPEDQRGAWDNEYKPDLNPKALLNTMGPKDQIKIVNPTINWIPSENPKVKIAQFWFEKERRIQGRPATKQSYLATLTFEYDPANIPSTVEGVIANAFGFTVLTYRSEAKGPEKEIVVNPQGGAR